MNLPRVFACSDHHFGHRNIIKYANRPFNIDSETCVLENTELMLKKHNQIVSKNDFVLLVGDLTLSKEPVITKNLLNKMNGTKILIIGNHDRLKKNIYLECGFIDVVDYLVIEDTFISHYPCYKTEKTKGKEKWLIQQLLKTNCTKIIHGHIHNKNPNTWKPDGYKRINVCVDYEPNNFYPIEITNLVTQKIIKKWSSKWKF